MIKILVKLRTELNLALTLNKHLAVTGASITGLVVNAIGIRVPMVNIHRSRKSLNCNDVYICILLACMLTYLLGTLHFPHEI